MLDSESRHPATAPPIDFVPPARRVSAAARWAALAPILIATAVSIYFSIWSMQTRLRMPYPQNPWESAILADAWRFSQGMPVYERLPRGHATHMYGPLTNFSIGAIFKVIGHSSLYVGRILSLASVAISCAILLWIFVPRGRWLAMLIAAGLLIGLHYRGRAYFVETRPDMIALLPALLATILFYRAQRTGRMWLYLPGTALVIVAMLFKQTYAAAAAVPPLAVLLSHWQRRDWPAIGHDLLIALAPLGAVIAAVIAMKLLTPNVFFYTIAEPAMYQIKPERAALAVISLVTLSPLFVALAAWKLLGQHEHNAGDGKMAWLIAAICIGSLASIPAFAKRGGSFNSLLLGFIPMTVFCCAMIDPMLRRLRSFRGGLAGIAAGWLIALLILVSTFCVPNSDLWNWSGAHGSPDYRAVISAVRALKGRVIVPDDPTILIAARNEVCRSLEAELDAANRPGGVPAPLAADIARADWFVRVHGHFDGFFTPEMMTNLGFRRVATKEAGPAFRKVYSLWKRIGPPTTQASSAPVRPKRRRSNQP